MNGVQIKLVQDSFRQVAPMAEAAAGLFYGRPKTPPRTSPTRLPERLPPRELRPR